MSDLGNVINQIFNTKYPPFQFKMYPLDFNDDWERIETKDSIIFERSIPGMDKSNFNISIKKNSLNVSSVKLDKDDSNPYFILFNQVIPTGCDIDLSSSEHKAKYINGILRIILKKTTSSIPLKIKVE